MRTGTVQGSTQKSPRGYDAPGTTFWAVLQNLALVQAGHLSDALSQAPDVTLQQQQEFNHRTVQTQLRRSFSARASPAVAVQALKQSLGHRHAHTMRAEQRAALTPSPRLYAQARSMPPNLAVAWDSSSQSEPGLTCTGTSGVYLT